MKKSILLIGCLVFFLGNHAHSVTLNEFVKSSDMVKNWNGFKDGQCFHCTDKESHVQIKGKTYEISTFRVVGLEGSNTYKNFEDLVSALKIGDKESATRKLYKDFPHLEFELMNIDAKDPKVKVLIALRPVTS